MRPKGPTLQTIFFADQYIVYCFRKKRRKNGKKLRNEKRKFEAAALSRTLKCSN